MRLFAVAAGCLMMLAAPLDASAQGHNRGDTGDAIAGEHDHSHAMTETMTETLGTVSFSTSCKPTVQPDFNRAVALMHSFQFGPAINSFRGIFDRDPECAIAYWGIALSSWGNPFAGFRSPAQLAQGWKAAEAGRAIAPKTARERAYIDAVAQLYADSARIDQSVRLNAYDTAMARVSAGYPDDIEARIFYALALASAADPADKTYAKQLKAGAMLEALFVLYPDHPGLAHYIIHAYDEPELASRAAEAARRYGNIAPSTPHALHMPSHTFTRIGDWQASIATNMASAASARKAGQPADELHASDYMVYAYLQTAQDEAARKLVLASAETFRRFDPANATGAAPPTTAFFANAAIPARYCLERRDWAAAMALTPYESPFPYADAITIFTKGLGAAHLKNAAVAQKSIADLADIRDRLTAKKDNFWADQTEIQRREVAAQLSIAQGDTAQALATLTRAVEMEDVTELASITPGPFVPAREMLGELLLDNSQPAQALVQFKMTLARHPNRFWSVYGAAQAAKSSDDVVTAQAYFQQLLAIAHLTDEPRRAALVTASEAVRGK
ncbi:tetratricopeptide repeat protein [Undibacterium sp. TJN25]|uniref:tetratricopeptide repeat protein n=1 Tax=Undibacterium sp. TJN25 TaxID=3413056 RepID=UPI003BF08543